MPAKPWGSYIHFGPKCWEWMGGKDEHGYGMFWDSGRNGSNRTHRHAWEIANGAIPRGMNVLHICDNPSCVRLDHLFLGTQLDNMKDMSNKGRSHWQKKTHCPKGHEYSPENTHVYMRNGTNEKRICKKCDSDRCMARRIIAGNNRRING